MQNKEIYSIITLVILVIYKNSLRTYNNNKLLYKNRGMDLESMINHSNEYYVNKDIAVIYKKPTPIGVVNVIYQNNHKIINKGYFKEQSTLDYNGIYKGKYIDFEAKVTKNKTSFPLSNVHKHQIEHIKKILKHKGIVFLIIMINDIVYLLPGEILIDFINKNTRKSIPYKYIKENGYEIKFGINPELDYLKIVDKIYSLEGENYGKEKEYK